MENRITTDQKETRFSIRHTGKAWRYIQDVTGTDAGNLDRKALEDGSRQYTYRLMFHEWERYASVFSALGITGEKHSRVGLLGSTQGILNKWTIQIPKIRKKRESVSGILIRLTICSIFSMLPRPRARLKGALSMIRSESSDHCFRMRTKSGNAAICRKYRNLSGKRC